jgi:hypothetical protein
MVDRCPGSRRAGVPAPRPLSRQGAIVTLTLSMNTLAEQLGAPPQTMASWNVIPSVTFAPAVAL